MPVNWLLSSGGKEDLPPEIVIGSASADDCAVKPLMSSAASAWGKRFFIGFILIEVTDDNVGLHLSQFGHVLDVYLPKVKLAD